MKSKKILTNVGAIQYFLKDLRENVTTTVQTARLRSKNRNTNWKSSLNCFISLNHSSKTYQSNQIYKNTPN